MIVRKENWGFMTWRYNCVTDSWEWGLAVGFGGPAKNDPGVCGPSYRYGFVIIWKRISDCIDWWAEYLGTERGRGVIVQYRVHSFRQFPIELRFYKFPGTT